MPVEYVNRVQGFAQRTFTAVHSSPFLPKVTTGKWRSPVTQRAIKADIFEFSNESSRPNSLTLDYAITLAERAFHLPVPAKILHLNDVFQQDLDIWTKSPGLPWRDLGYKTKGDIKRDPEAIRRVRKFWHIVKDRKHLIPPDCLAFVRSHICDIGEEKVRAVWGYPATMTFGEAVFAIPLIKSYQQRDGPIAYGFETAIGGMRKLYRRFTRGSFYAGLDFKKFDKTIPNWLIDIAFKILLSNLDLVEYHEHGVADARRMLFMYTYIENYFINTTIRTADGRRYRKDTGIASGSYFTQLVGSISNYILCQWIHLEQFGRPVEDILVLGDDSFMSTSELLNIEKANSLMSSIGMRLNLEKSETTSNLHSIKFLGYSIGNGVPFKSRDTWMTALAYPETPDYCLDQLQSRALGLYYANMCVDAGFAHLCKHLVKMKPFQLMVSREFERKMKFIGISLEVLKTGVLPTALQFALKMI